jgi:hypothetical protein
MARKKAEEDNCGVHILSSSEVRGLEDMRTCLMLTFVFGEISRGMRPSMGDRWFCLRNGWMGGENHLWLLQTQMAPSRVEIHHRQLTLDLHKLPRSMPRT